jgi:hypothetical protein
LQKPIRRLSPTGWRLGQRQRHSENHTERYSGNTTEDTSGHINLLAKLRIDLDRLTEFAVIIHPPDRPDV